MPVYFRAARNILAACIVISLVIIPGVTASGLMSSPVYAAGSDLVVQGIELSPSAPELNDSVTFTVTIKNQGSANSGPSQTACYIDSGLLANAATPALTSGTITTITFTWQAGAGSHTIRAVADSSGSEEEADESNNTRTYTITTLVADLTVQSLTWTPTNISQGDAVTISIVIANQGSAISHSTNVQLYIDGNPRGSQDFATLNPGTSVTKTYSWFAQAGQHELKAVADEAALCAEANENNNVLKTTFSTQAADLLITAFTWAPASPSRNDDVSFNVTIKNQGSGRADPSSLAYFVDGEMISSLDCIALETGVSANLTFSWKAQSDSHEIRVVADFYERVQESDETNNQKTGSFQTLKPDLTVSDITWAPTSPAVGDTVTVTATITNLGGGRADASRSVVYIDGAFITYLNIPQLPGKASTTAAFQWTVTGGSHPVAVVADYDDLVIETYQDNNRLDKTIMVKPADLTITGLSWTPQFPDLGQNVVFTLTVKNIGAGDADSFDVGFYLDNSPLTGTKVAGLDSGASTNLTYTWKAENGRHVLRAAADFNRALAEGNENNNEISATIVPNMPDLDIGAVTWSPTTISAGGEVVFEIPVENTGSMLAGPSRIAFYVDGAPAGYTDIGQLDPKGFHAVQFRWDATSGIHTIEIIADSAGKIVEIDEENNKKTVVVPPPDLVIQELTWTPPDAADGDSLIFSATIKNQGASRIEEVPVTCYVDGKAIGTQKVAGLDIGGTAAASFNWTAAYGSHKIKIVSDAENMITEADETNNEIETVFGTLTPDLYVHKISWHMENPLIDNRAQFVITVGNQGSGASAPGRYKYNLDDEPGVFVNLDAVRAGEKLEITLDLPLEAGEHTFKVTLDTRKDSEELDETNNTGTITFSTLAPDLLIKTISVSPVMCKAGDPVTVTVKVENQGLNAAKDARLTVAVDGKTIGTAEMGEIASGVMVTRDFTWKAAPGEHEFSAMTNLGRPMLESNQDNNTRTRNISIETPGTNTVNKIDLSSATDADKGFLGNYWWLIITGAAVLGIGSFLMVLRSFRKE